MAILLLRLLTGWGNAASPSLRPHEPILIEGDADLCDGDDDGVTNCATADGSAERPYRIEGLRLAILENPACTDASPCTFPGSCVETSPSRGFAFDGALTLCRTTKHVVVEGLVVEVGQPLVIAQRSEGEQGCRAEDSCTILWVGLSLRGASNVTLRNVQVSAHGLGLYAGEAVDTEGRRWPARGLNFDHLAVSAPSLADASQVLEEHRALVRVEDADVTVESSTFEAAGRSHGLFVDATASTERGEERRLAMRNSAVRDAAQFGLRVLEATVTLHGNVFDGNGQPGAALYASTDALGRSSTSATPSGAALLELGPHPSEVVGNRFTVEGLGLLLGGNGTGRLELNRFEPGGGAGGALRNEIAVFLGDEHCRVNLNYNALNGLRVVQDAFTCPLDARFNWWTSATDGPGQAPAQPQADGRVTVEPWLKAAPWELPAVAIESPASGSVVSGRVEVTGTAVPFGSAAVSRVESTRTRNDWSGATGAGGLASWRLDWGMDEEPLGALSLWVRACDELDCGVPQRLDVVNVESPAPPVAILEVSPRHVRVGDAVLLDASASYSPQGRALAAYRFDLGDGRVTAWGRESRLETSFASPRTYTVAVETRDEADLVNTNAAQAVVRVTGESAVVGSSEKEGKAVPGAGSVLAALGLVVALGAARAARGKKG